MKTLIVLVFGLAAVLAAPASNSVPSGPAFWALPTPDKLIVGGQEGTIENFPYLVSMRRSGSHSCGGSIIRTNWVLTAAHCLTNVDASIITFLSGSTSRLEQGTGTIHQANLIVLHPGYNSPTSFNNDAALVRVNEPFSFGIIALPALGSDQDDGDAVIVSGWGTTASGGSSPVNLHWVEVYVWSRERCAGAYGAIITENMVCASAPGRDSCQGDSGGPLTKDGAVVGIVSFGQGCAQEAFPGVYARVSAPSVYNWIQETLANN